MSFRPEVENYQNDKDKDRWSKLLCQTISALCKNGMIGSDVIKIQGLIGITLGNQEVFLVDIRESFDLSETTAVSTMNCSLAPRIKSRKRKASHPKSARPAEETFSQDCESNNDMDLSLGYDLKAKEEPTENSTTEDGNGSADPYYDISCVKNEREEVDYPDFDQCDDSALTVQGFASLIADEPVTPSRKPRAKKDFSQTVATTKHTAELLGYQDFTPSSSRPYTCRLCEASFSKKFCLANHIVTVHQVGGKYICKQCGRQFLQKNRYNLHMDRHNDISKLICPNCGKATLKSNYESHLKKCSSGPKKEIENGEEDGGNDEGVPTEVGEEFPDEGQIKEEEEPSEFISETEG